jgi:L,D-peptidoglycan transpeptidase YkuD (ErfK/YbiS/YcfS/YnhG family)
MKTQNIFFFLIFVLIQYYPVSVSADNIQKTEQKVQSIIKKNILLLDSINQLLVVINEPIESSNAIVIAMEKSNNQWQPVGLPIPAGIGRKGFAGNNEKREGDQKSPSGFFRFGQLFCYDQVVDTKMPFIHTTAQDKWIDDPDSPDYNQHVRGTTAAKSYEKMLIRSDEYKYCLVIEYNMHPVKPGNGSAIFIHLSEGDQPNASAGCVVITQTDMERLLKWMLPEKKPSILMGNEKVLLKGLY